MIALKMCFPGGGGGGILPHVSLFRVFLQEIAHDKINVLNYNSSVGHLLKSFPVFGAVSSKSCKYLYKDGDSGRVKNDCVSSGVNERSPELSHLKGGGVVDINNLTYFTKTLSNFFNRFISSPEEINANIIMPSVEAMAQLENNAQTADNLIQEIYSKLALLQNCNPALGEEAQKLIQENEALKQEVQKWKEMLILQQIKNGGNPTVRDAKLLERSAVVASTDSVKQEAPSKEKTASPAPQQPEGKTEPAPQQQQQQQQGKKGKNKGGDGNAIAAGGAPKGGKPKAGGEAAPAAAADAQGNEEVDVGRLDLRIGLIKECTRHPDADSLYVEKIDCGEPNVRTVISGLVKHVPIDAMQNRLVVVLCNLKPSKMRGISSEAMVMCASSPEKVEILTPPAGSVPGDVIQVEGYTRRPDAVLNPKKKIFETVAPDLKTNDKKQATYKGVPWTVPEKGFVVAESLVNVNVK